MLESIIKAFERTPEILALLLLVYLFLKAQSETRREFIHAIRDIQSENLNEREKSREILHECVKSNCEAAMALRSLEHHIVKDKKT